MLKKTLAGAALAVALIITPVAAHAATYYVPSSNVSVSNPSPAAGGEVTVTFTESFLPGEDVTFSVTGNGTATLAVLKAATATLTKKADANGTVAVKVTLPADATGTYNVTATGKATGTVGTAAITVKAADAGAPADGGKGEVVGGGKDSAGGLPRTGGELPGGLIWIAGGASVLGLALITTLAVRRKNA